MTPEEITSKLENLETTLGEHGDSLIEANKVRDQLTLLRGAVRELAEAIKLLPDAYEMQIAGGKDQAGGRIKIAADKVIRDLSS